MYLGAMRNTPLTEGRIQVVKELPEHRSVEKLERGVLSDDEFNQMVNQSSC